MTEIVLVDNDAAIRRVSALARLIWASHYTAIIGAAQVEYMLEKFQSVAAVAQQIAQGYDYFMVSDGTQEAGYFALVPNVAEARLMLSKVYILPAFQGRGLGRAVIAFAENRCAEKGFCSIWLTVNKNNVSSIAFYERMGFRKESAVVSDIGCGFVMDDYVMAKRVGA